MPKHFLLQHRRNTLMQRCGRVLVFTLFLSLCIPLPLIGGAASARVRDDAPGTAHVWQRLNSPERQRAIEEANRIDATAHEAFGKSEEERHGLPRG